MTLKYRIWILKYSFVIHNSVRAILMRSISDPGCLSRIPDPDFPISDLGPRIQKQEKRGGKNEICIPIFFVAINFKNGAEKN
jgi:hypothetical protein